MLPVDFLLLLLELRQVGLTLSLVTSAFSKELFIFAIGLFGLLLLSELQFLLRFVPKLAVDFRLALNLCQLLLDLDLLSVRIGVLGPVRHLKVIIDSILALIFSFLRIFNGLVILLCLLLDLGESLWIKLRARLNTNGLLRIWCTVSLLLDEDLLGGLLRSRDGSGLSSNSAVVILD